MDRSTNNYRRPIRFSATFMNSKALLTLLAFGAYCLGATYYYTSIIKGFGQGRTSEPAPIEIPVAVDTPAVEKELELPYRINFLWNDPRPYVRRDFDAFRDSLIKTVSSNEALLVTGYYFDGEEKPEDQDNLGLARADSVRQLLKPFFGRVQIAAAKGRFSEDLKNDPFWACDFTTVLYSVYAEESNDSIVVFFPEGQDRKVQAKAMEEALSKAAKRFAKLNARLQVTGLFEASGKNDKGKKIAEKHAEEVFQTLIKKGVPKKNLSMKVLAMPARPADDRHGSEQRVVIRIVRAREKK
jgi:outer membrane protein OmpA-like peptidoglycan-associated protein